MRALLFSCKPELFTLILKGRGRDRKPAAAFSWKSLLMICNALGEAWMSCLAYSLTCTSDPFPKCLDHVVSGLVALQLLQSVLGTPLLFPCIACGIISYLASLTGHGYWWIFPVGSVGLRSMVALKSHRHVKVFRFTSKNKA